MKIYILGFFSLTLCSLLFADETKEPEVAYTLHINGKSVRIEAGKEVEMKGEFKDLKIELVRDKSKKFDFGGVEFEYPVHMAFAAELDDDLKIWTLDGNEMILMYYQFPNQKMSGQEFAESIATQYGKDATIVPTKIKLNGVEYQCSRLNITLAGVKLHQTVFSLPSEKGSRLFMIQDNEREEGENEEESVEIMKLLESTFKVK